MSLKVYEMAHSPYCIPVTHALECHGIPFERVVIPNWDRREVARVTEGRYYQVPVVVDGNEIVVETEEDFLAVPRYLDRTRLGGTLFPAEWNGVHEILVEHIEGKLESFSFKLTDIHYIAAMEDLGERTMTIRHKERSFGRGCVEQWRRDADALRAEFEGLLDAFDQRLQQAPFLYGDSPLYADFALFGVLGNYTYKGYNAFPDSLEALLAWHSRLIEFRAE